MTPETKLVRTPYSDSSVSAEVTTFKNGADIRIAFEEARRKIDEQTVPQSKASSQATDDAVGTDHKEP